MTIGKPYAVGSTYITPEGETVSMYRHRQRVRFYTADGRQVGPTHTNVAPAVTWAAYYGWVDPDAPVWLTVGMRAEVRANARFSKKRADGR